MQIAKDPVTGPDIIALLTAHRELMVSQSPPCSVHSLNLDALRAPSVTVWTLRDDDGRLLGCAALKEIDPAHGEIKSMHTAAADRGKGVGAALLRHIEAEAIQRGYTRLSLETGSPEGFSLAHRLYQRFGFVRCAPFADYTDDPFSLCMTKDLPCP